MINNVNSFSLLVKERKGREREGEGEEMDGKESIYKQIQIGRA